MKKLLAALTAGMLAAGAWAQAPSAPAEAPAPAVSATPATTAPEAKTAKAPKVAKTRKATHKKVAKKHTKKAARHTA